MHKELIIAGAGGQGIMFIGKIICTAAIEEEKFATRFPSYGPAMRGGEATCTVIISSEEIGSPISEHPDVLIIMNRPSLKFADLVKPGGLVLINKSLVDWDDKRKDVEVLEIRASDIARELGDPLIANLVMLGAYLKKDGIVSLENVMKDLKGLNKKAFEMGIAQVN